MRVEILFPSKYLAASDLLQLPKKEAVYTIDRITQDFIESSKGREQKGLLEFREAKKPMVLNRTNAKTIAKLYGPETDDWSGHRVTLYVAEVEAFGEQVLAIRVRPSIPGGFAGKAASAIERLNPLEVAEG
jgi:hypothetical protein